MTHINKVTEHDLVTHNEVLIAFNVFITISLAGYAPAKNDFLFEKVGILLAKVINYIKHIFLSGLIV